MSLLTSAAGLNDHFGRQIHNASWTPTDLTFLKGLTIGSDTVKVIYSWWDRGLAGHTRLLPKCSFNQDLFCHLSILAPLSKFLTSSKHDRKISKICRLTAMWMTVRCRYFLFKPPTWVIWMSRMIVCLHLSGGWPVILLSWMQNNLSCSLLLPTARFLRRIVLSGHQVSSVCSNLRNLGVIVIKLLIYTNMSGACLLSLSLPPSPENCKSRSWKMVVGAFVPSRRDYSQFACQLSRQIIH